jgi:hypothetical protein
LVTSVRVGMLHMIAHHPNIKFIGGDAVEFRLLLLLDRILQSVNVFKTRISYGRSTSCPTIEQLSKIHLAMKVRRATEHCHSMRLRGRGIPFTRLRPNVFVSNYDCCEIFATELDAGERHLCRCIVTNFSPFLIPYSPWLFTTLNLRG